MDVCVCVCVSNKENEQPCRAALPRKRRAEKRERAAVWKAKIYPKPHRAQVWLIKLMRSLRSVLDPARQNQQPATDTKHSST